MCTVFMFKLPICTVAHFPLTLEVFRPSTKKWRKRESFVHWFDARSLIHLVSCVIVNAKCFRLFHLVGNFLFARQLFALTKTGRASSTTKPHRAVNDTMSSSCHVIWKKFTTLREMEQKEQRTEDVETIEINGRKEAKSFQLIIGGRCRETERTRRIQSHTRTRLDRSNRRMCNGTSARSAVRREWRLTRIGENVACRLHPICVHGIQGRAVRGRDGQWIGNKSD